MSSKENLQSKKKNNFLGKYVSYFMIDFYFHFYDWFWAKNRAVVLDRFCFLIKKKPSKQSIMPNFAA